MTIADLKTNDRFIIKKINLKKDIGKRLCDMGFIKGASGRVVRTTLLGDPIQINILDYNVSIRRSEAKGIEVEKI